MTTTECDVVRRCFRMTHRNAPALVTANFQANFRADELPPPPPPPSLRKIPDVTHVCIQYIYHVGHVWQHAIQVIVFRCSLHLVEKAVLLLMLFSEVMIVIEIVE